MLPKRTPPLHQINPNKRSNHLITNHPTHALNQMSGLVDANFVLCADSVGSLAIE